MHDPLCVFEGYAKSSHRCLHDDDSIYQELVGRTLVPASAWQEIISCINTASHTAQQTNGPTATHVQDPEIVPQPGVWDDRVEL